MFNSIFEHKNVIAMSSSNEYVPYLLVYLFSIFEHVSSDGTYDIVILESDITEENKKIISNYSTSQVSIRFINVKNIFENIDLHIQFDYFAIQCYYRLALGEIFTNCNRVLFTDIDLITNKDINAMFNIDMQNYPLAACEEIIWKPENREKYNVVDYVKKIVPISNKYFNTGVLLIDIKKFNESVSLKELLKIAKANKFINQEQCVLNKVFDNNFCQIDKKYNYEIYNGILKNKENKELIEYSQEIDNAYIYHYLTKHKVWFEPELPKGYLWWEYARKTPFYEVILSRMNEYKINEKLASQSVNYDAKLKELSNTHNELLKNLASYKNNLKNYNKYRFLSNFVFGKTKERYILKKRIFKEKIQTVKTFLK